MGKPGSTPAQSRSSVETLISGDSKVVIRRSGDGRTIGIVGDVYRFLVTVSETGGRCAVFEATVLPGGGPPPHRHSREDESFYVIEGEITFQLEDGFVTAGSGAFVNMPIGTPHAFKNNTDRPATMLISCAPAGLALVWTNTGIERNSLPRSQLTLRETDGLRCATDSSPVTNQSDNNHQDE